MTDHEILVAAKAYLLNHGWKQDDYGTHGGPRCVLGAIRSAGRESDEGRAVCCLEAALLTIDGDAAWIPGWNDAPARTLDDVITALDRAILATAPVDAPTPELVTA